MTQKKEYIKNLIIRSFKGKANQAEIQQVKDELMNCSREDLRDLKIVGKELAKEAVEEQCDKEFNWPSDWKGLIRDFQHSGVNLIFAVVDEEIIYQAILLEKQGELNDKTKIIKILPAVSQSLDRIVARAPSRNINSNWKADKRATAKLKKVMREVRGFYIKAVFERGQLNERDVKQQVSKLMSIYENLTSEEIAVLKGKTKIFVNNCIDKFAPSQIKDSPEIRQFVNSVMNFFDVVCDDKSLKDFIDIAVKALKLATQNEEIWKEKDPLMALQKTGTETEAKNLVRNYTQHLNRLAGEGEKTQLSTEKEENIIKRLTKNNSNPQPNQEGTELKDILENNLLVQELEKSSQNLEGLTQSSLQKEFEKVFLNTQIKPKWYQNPWIIWPLVAVVLVIGGLIIWWLTGRKKEKKINTQSNDWNNY